MDVPVVFTKKYSLSTLNDFMITDEHIIHDNNLIPIKVYWDTGSFESVISNNLVDKLSLKSIGTAVLSGANSKLKTGIYEIIFLLAETQPFTLEVTTSSEIGDKGVDMLIGLDIISQCDFVISENENDLYMSVRCPSQGIIDFTKE